MNVMIICNANRKTLSTLPTNSSPCQEADGPSFIEPEGSLQRSQQPAYILPRCSTSFNKP